MTDEIQPAPAGFTDEQWRAFMRDGLIHREGVLAPAKADALLRAAQECIQGQAYDKDHTSKVENVISAHPEFQTLIDLDTHIGYPYDIFGDQIRLSQNDLFVRRPGSVVNHWHIDGPRAVPYRVFSPVLPLKLRIGYWLTDLPHENMANLVYLPGSHRAGYAAEHTDGDNCPGCNYLWEKFEAIM